MMWGGPCVGDTWALLELQSTVRMAYGCFWPLLSPAAAGVFPTGKPCS